MELILEWIRTAGPWALVAIFGGAAAEYMVPPLPADSVVLAGALLVVSGEFSFGTVFLVAVAGGMLGALSHYYIGARLMKSGKLIGNKWVEKLTGKGGIEKFFVAFKRRGMWLIVFNRALPGVRAVTFLAAGAAGLPFAPTMLAGLISHSAWIAMILAVGVSIGESWEKIEAAFDLYQRVVYVLGGVGLVAYLGFRWFRSRRASKEL
jgi:membrane-associated protein